jgi:hypothetical protein
LPCGGSPWPIFFFTIWGLINWRRINRRVESLVERAVRAAARNPGATRALPGVATTPRSR